MLSHAPDTTLLLNNNPTLNNDLPCLKFIVVNAISISEDEEVVLLITLAGFVLHVPVILPGNLVVIP